MNIWLQIEVDTSDYPQWEGYLNLIHAVEEIENAKRQNEEAVTIQSESL